jgi:hypothetical protein
LFFFRNWSPKFCQDLTAVGNSKNWTCTVYTLPLFILAIVSTLNFFDRQLQADQISPFLSSHIRIFVCRAGAQWLVIVVWQAINYKYEALLGLITTSWLCLPYLAITDISPLLWPCTLSESCPMYFLRLCAVLHCHKYKMMGRKSSFRECILKTTY